ncbi:AbiTii domain-containing protein [Paraburkholderia sp. RL17-337-BIB-A]|uniref:AbiTii domain-containing protein n=1 Tax=Paraburkholderia sp. RL17-337-BIB-A TaxID=3031636 RepID=UPI0038BB9DF9
MRLITEIIDLLSSENANLADALFKAKVLAHRMGQPELKAWIDSELDGYPNAADLPLYRVLAITCVANVTDGYTQYNGHALPTWNLEERLRARVTRSDLRQSIVVVEQFSRAEKELVIPFPPEYHKALEKGLRPGVHIMSAWGRVSAGAHLQVVVEVRSRLLEFMLQLEEKVPEQLDGVSFKDLATQIGVGTMFKGAVFGDNVNINIGGGSQSHMTSSVR